MLYITHLKNFWNSDWFVEIEFRVSAQTLENKCHVTSIETTVYLIITFNKSINTNNLFSDPWSSKALSHKQRTFGHEILKFICLWRYNNTCIICTCIQKPAQRVSMLRILLNRNIKQPFPVYILVVIDFGVSFFPKSANNRKYIMSCL